MIFDELGLPKDEGSSDLQDSARLAGLAVVFGFDLAQNKNIPIEKYVVTIPALGSTHYVRHPLEYKYDFSRDQAICLMAGLHKAGMYRLVDKKYIDGKDIFSPSHNGHVRICQGKKPRFYQSAWLMLDILYSVIFTPRDEPNQLLCMLMVHPNKFYLKFWLKHNKHWPEAILLYWAGWRNEFKLADHMIQVLKGQV
jgi:hypothetical protein